LELSKLRIWQQVTVLRTEVRRPPWPQRGSGRGAPGRVRAGARGC